jgi:hypothetical protein
LYLHDSDRRASAANTPRIAKGGVDDEVGDCIAVKMEVMDNTWIECLRVNGPVGGQRPEVEGEASIKGYYSTTGMEGRPLQGVVQTFTVGLST